MWVLSFLSPENVRIYLCAVWCVWKSNEAAPTTSAMWFQMCISEGEEAEVEEGAIAIFPLITAHEFIYSEWLRSPSQSYQ